MQIFGRRRGLNVGLDYTTTKKVLIFNSNIMSENLKKRKKSYLLDMLREAYPWKPRWWYGSFTKDEIIKKLNEAGIYE